MNIELNVNGKLYRCLLSKLEKTRATFKDCDQNGNEVKKTFIPAKTEYHNASGVEIPNDEIYKLIGGKPRARARRTKLIENAKLVPLSDVEDLIIEGYYLVETEGLNEYLRTKKRALRFAFTNGNGFKVYEAYLIPFKDVVIMVTGLGSLAEEVKNICSGRFSGEKKRQIMENSNVPRMKEEELFNELMEA